VLAGTVDITDGIGSVGVRGSSPSPTLRGAASTWLALVEWGHGDGRNATGGCHESMRPGLVLLIVSLALPLLADDGELDQPLDGRTVAIDARILRPA
jgi:hypothetical protein